MTHTSAAITRKIRRIEQLLETMIDTLGDMKITGIDIAHLHALSTVLGQLMECEELLGDVMGDR